MNQYEENGDFAQQNDALASVNEVKDTFPRANCNISKNNPIATYKINKKVKPSAKNILAKSMSEQNMSRRTSNHNSIIKSNASKIEENEEEVDDEGGN